jgi:hypothetical protein
MKKELLIIAVVFLMMSCGGKSNAPTPVPPTPPKPTQALLSAPAQNAVCTTGTNPSATQSTISFSWNASANTNNYSLVIKNLLTSDSTTQSTSQTQLDVILLRNTPYSWYVVSQSNQTSATAKSAIWKFYNSGPGIITYAPFPADITSPAFAQNVTASAGTVNLTWTGSVVTPDVIANYDVYFGTTSSPAIMASAITISFLNNVSVASKTTYYWKVITRDAVGNTSDSGLFQFTVN